MTLIYRSKGTRITETLMKEVRKIRRDLYWWRSRLVFRMKYYTAMKKNKLLTTWDESPRLNVEPKKWDTKDYKLNYFIYRLLKSRWNYSMVIEIGIIVILKTWHWDMRELSGAGEMLICWFGSQRGIRHLKIKLYTYLCTLCKLNFNRKVKKYGI